MDDWRGGPRPSWGAGEGRRGAGGEGREIAAPWADDSQAMLSRWGPGKAISSAKGRGLGGGRAQVGRRASPGSPRKRLYNCGARSFTSGGKHCGCVERKWHLQAQKPPLGVVTEEGRGTRVKWGRGAAGGARAPGGPSSQGEAADASVRMDPFLPVSLAKRPLSVFPGNRGPYFVTRIGYTELKTPCYQDTRPERKSPGHGQVPASVPLGILGEGCALHPVHTQHLDSQAFLSHKPWGKVPCS